MQHTVGVAVLALACVSALTLGDARVAAEPRSGEDAVSRRARPPRASSLYFESNRGQHDDAVDFLARSPGYDTFLAGGAAVIVLPPDDRGLRAAVHLRLDGARPVPGVAGPPRPGSSHYLIGRDRTSWVRHVPHFSDVVYSGVRPGVDLTYRGAGRRLRFDLELAAGAPTDALTFTWVGATSLDVADDGTLEVRVDERRIAVSAPIAYQPQRDRRLPVRVVWSVEGHDRARLVVGAYDRHLPLVIDPTLDSSTYLGGTLDDVATSIAVGDDREVAVAATSLATDFPTTTGAYATSAPTAGTSGTQDNVVVTKFAADRETLEFSTYVGGSNSDQAADVAVDADGRVLVCGRTFSTNFPLEDAYSEDVTATSSEAFLLKLTDDGSDLVWSTFLGDDVASANALVLDDSDKPHVVGSKSTFDGASVIPGLAVVKLAADGQSADFTVRLVLTSSSNPSSMTATDVAVDDDGNVFLAGYSSAHSIPTTTGAYQRQLPGYNSSSGQQPDAGFVYKLTSTGGVSWGTYLGGAADDERIEAIAVADDGGVVVVGSTDSSNFPLVQASNSQFSGSRMAFVTWIAGDGESLTRSTFYGGDGADAALALAIDANGDLHVAGRTTSDDFPTTDDAYADERTGEDANDGDAWLARFNSTGVLEYSTYLGSTGNDHARDIALDCGRVHMVGTTTSAADDSFPTVNAYATTASGQDDLFVATFESPHTIAIDDDEVPQWTEGRPFSHQFTVDGHDGGMTWTRTAGSLPVGITLSTDGELSGSPVAAATTSITIQATSSCGADDTRTFDLIVNSEPGIDGADDLGWTVGRTFAFDLETIGGTGEVSLVPGPLPAWLDLSDAHVLSGTPPAPGVVHFEVSLADERGAQVIETVTFTTHPEPAVATATLEETTEDVPHEWTLVPLGGTAPFTWSYEGASSPGAYSMTAATGVLRGRPSVPGDVQISVAVVDASGVLAQASVDVHVNPFPTVAPFTVPVGAVGRPFELQLVGTGGTPAAEWSVAGGLPSGLSLDATTGRLHGTPTVAGMSTRSLVYRDARGAEVSQSVNVVVAERIALDAKKNRLDLDVNLLTSDRTRHLYLELLRGTTLSVKMSFTGKGKKKSKGPFPYDVALLDSSGIEIPLTDRAKEGKRTFAIKKLPIVETGRYVLRLTPAEAFEGKVSIAVTPKPARGSKGAFELSSAETTTIRLPVLAGATFGFQVKAAKKSPALPEIVAIMQGGVDLLAGATPKTKGKSSKVAVKNPTDAGEVTIVIASRDGAGGPVMWKANVKSPKIYGLELPDLASTTDDDS